MQEFCQDAEGFVKQMQHIKQDTHKLWIAWVATGKWLLHVPASFSKGSHLQNTLEPSNQEITDAQGTSSG